MRVLAGVLSAAVCVLVAAAVSAGAGEAGAIEPAPAKSESGGGGGDAVLLDVNLTAGEAGKQAIEKTGGNWDGGWIVVKGGCERLVWDLGREVPAGVLEITLTAAEVKGKTPWADDKKLNWAGAYQSAQLSHRAPGSKVYLRTGNSKYGFSRLKVSDKPFDHTELEASLGKTSNWTLDGKTVHTIRLTWSPGKLQFEGPGGISAQTEKYKSFGSLRYVFVGCDKSYSEACAGMKFLSVKVTETKP